MDGNLTGTTTLGPSGPGNNGNKEYSTFPKLQDCNLTIRWFTVISRTLFDHYYSSAEMKAVHSTAPADNLVHSFYL